MSARDDLMSSILDEEEALISAHRKQVGTPVDSQKALEMCERSSLDWDFSVKKSLRRGFFHGSIVGSAGVD